jgi:hypothetical protein
MAPPSRPLIAIAMDGSRKVFRNVREAEQETSVPRASIVRAAQGLTKRGEWLWKFEDDEREPELAGQHAPILTETDRELAREFVHALTGSDGGVITEMRLSDGYINATLIAQSAGKTFSHWYAIQGTTEYLEALSQDLHCSVSDLVQTNRTGSESRFSWVHPEAASHLAQWCSPQFAIQVNRLVVRYLSGRLTAGESQAAAAEVVRQATNIPEKSSWNQNRWDGIEITKVNTGKIKEYVESHFGGQPGGAHLYAVIGNIISQGTVGYESTTRQYKLDTGIPKELNIPDMLDAGGQFVRMYLLRAVHKYFSDHQDVWETLTLEQIILDLKVMRDSLLGCNRVLGMDDVERHMLSVGEAKDAKKKFNALKKVNPIQTTPTSLIDRGSVVQNTGNTTATTVYNTITNYFGPREGTV